MRPAAGIAGAAAAGTEGSAGVSAGLAGVAVVGVAAAAGSGGRGGLVYTFLLENHISNDSDLVYSRAYTTSVLTTLNYTDLC